MDRNVWDPKTPPGFVNLGRNGLAVELCIYFYEHSAKTNDQARADVEGAARIWCASGINVQAVHMQRLPRLPVSEPLDLNSPTLSDLIACGKLTDLERNQLFAVGRPGCPGAPRRSVAVYYVPGHHLQGGATGCHQFRFQGDGEPEHLILLTDDAIPRVLAHELGHALFTRRSGASWINHDPGPGTNPSNRPHNTNPQNLMFPTVPPNPQISSQQIAQAKQCLLTLRQNLTFGFKQNKPFKLGVRMKTLHVKMTDDEAFSDDALESKWVFRVGRQPQGGAAATTTTIDTKNFAQATLKVRDYHLGLEFRPVELTDTQELVISSTGFDEDFWSGNDNFPESRQVHKKGGDMWGANSGAPPGDHKPPEKSSSDIRYTMTYNIRVVDAPREDVFRNLC